MKVTMDTKGCIGKDNIIPFYMKDDRAHFLDLTKKIGKVCVGRCYQETIIARLGEPLRNRETFVLSRTLTAIKKCTVVSRPCDIITLSQENDVCVIGGAQVFQLFLPFTQKMFVTHVDACISNGDAHFPQIDPEIWEAKLVLKHIRDAWNEFAFRIVEYDRRPRTL